MEEKVVAVVEQKPVSPAPAEEEKALSQSVSEVEQMASAIIINSEADYKKAAEFGRMLKQRNAQVTEFFAPMKKAAHEAHKNICDREKAMLDPLKKAEATVKSIMGNWVMEQERIRRAEEERLRKQAEEEAARKLEEAIKLEEQGKSKEAEAAASTAAVIDTVAKNIAVVTDKPKADGVSTTTDWEITSIDSNIVPCTIGGINIRPVDEAAVKRLIKASNGTIEIPGVKFKAVTRMTFRR